MALNLRKDEDVLAEADFHWLVYAYPFLWFAAGFFIILSEIDIHQIHYVWIGIVLILPFLYKYISNKCKQYIVTSQRIYISSGILSRRENEIPIQKINNVEMTRSILQMFFGAGNVLILVGNDAITEINYIAQPQKFKDAISFAIESQHG
jgi:uncharacterized membrane protein YdbT with pleckstrin-like domain